MQLLWWHWLILGLGLLLIELAIPAFFIVWFGLGALVVGLVAAMIDVPLGAQVLLWTLFSLAFVWLWFRVFKKDAHKTTIGFSKGQFIGEIGLVTRDIRPYQQGQIRFQKPILGDDVWQSIADEEIPVGERVRVIDVQGNILKVGRIIV
ncbi:MAG: NfeD family protein [Burkholderiales bacterium]|nr:NfeD family protein [Burkholderiales bacterium]